MYTLHYSPGSASTSPHAVLEELGLPFKLALVDTSTGAHREPAYLKLNPAGRVPALTLENGTAMAESAGICIFLADRHPEAGLAPALADPARGTYLHWFMHLTNTLQPADLRFYYPERYTAGADVDGVKTKAVEEIIEAWGRVEAHLAAKGPYILGDRFSAVDIFCFMLASWDSCPNLAERFPQVKRLADLVAARPAVQRMLQAN